MKLFYAPFSPFARKCRVVIIEKGLENRVELINAAPMENPPELIAANPLASVPALLTEDGSYLCESPVICEYLDTLSDKPKLIPADAKQRFKVLGLAALADGIMDAAVACVLESRRPEDKRYPEWVARKENAIKRSTELLAGKGFSGRQPLDIGLINTVIALNYVSFRLPHIDWRAAHPKLAGWYDEMSTSPSLASTAPVA